jgi:hypothetical protein
MTAQTTVLFFNLIIYVLIVAAFNRARNKYAGGKVGDMVNIILATVFLLFLADYVQVLGPYLNSAVVFTVESLARTGALACLAFGGIRVSAG